MVTALSRLSALTLLLLLGGCYAGLDDGSDTTFDDETWIPAAGDDDDATEDDDGLPTPQGPYQGEAIGTVDGASCSGFAWLFVGATGVIDGFFDCPTSTTECSFSVDALAFDEEGQLESVIDSCRGEVTLRLDAVDGEVTASALGDDVSVEIYTVYTPEEGD